MKSIERPGPVSAYESLAAWQVDAARYRTRLADMLDIDIELLHIIGPEAVAERASDKNVRIDDPKYVELISADMNLPQHVD